MPVTVNIFSLLVGHSGFLFLRNCLFIPFDHFSTEFPVFFLLICRGHIYIAVMSILDITHLVLIYHFSVVPLFNRNL